MTGPASKTSLRSPQIHLGSKQVLRVVWLNASRSLLKLLSWGRPEALHLLVVLYFITSHSSMRPHAHSHTPLSNQMAVKVMQGAVEKPSFRTHDTEVLLNVRGVVNKNAMLLQVCLNLTGSRDVNVAISGGFSIIHHHPNML